MSSRASLSRVQTAAASSAVADVVRHDDSRLSDARTPSAHAASHAPGGGDSLAGSYAPLVGPISTKTATYTLTDADAIVVFNTSSGAATANLPTAVGRTGKRFIIKKLGGATANPLTIDPSGSETVDGQATEIISVAGGFRDVVSDGTNWHIVGGKIEPVVISLGSIAGAGTITCDASAGSMFRATLTGSTATLAVPSNPIDADVINVEVYNSTGSASSLTINASVVLTGGITSPISIPAGKILSLALRYRGTTSPATVTAAWRLLASSLDA